MVTTIARTNTLSSDLWTDGHVLIPEVAICLDLPGHRDAIRKATGRFANETHVLEDRDTYGKAFLQVTNLWLKDEAVRSFVFQKRFAQIAADLLEADKVR